MGYIDEQNYETEQQMYEIRAEINALDQLMRAQDYIGVKIAMGRATKEEYVEEIAQSEQWAQRKNDLEEMLKQITTESDITDEKGEKYEDSNV